MSTTNTPIFPQTPISTVTQFTSSTSTSTPTSILTAQTNGAKIEAIIVASTNTAPQDFVLSINISATNYAFVTVTIPTTAGTVDTIPTVSIFKAVTSGNLLLPLPLDSNGNPYLYLSSVASLTANPAVALASTKVWNILVMGGAY